MKKTTSELAPTFFLLALGLVVLGFSLSSASVPAGSVRVVEFREDGFYPSIISIQRGDTVVFKNAAERAFWPASNIHPSHGLYPAFDPKKPVAAGEFWSFPFERSGTWDFHDHLAPSFTGTIFVRDETGAVAGVVCESQSREYHCWLQELRGVLDDAGVEAAFLRMAELYREDEVFANSCHSLAHDVGIAAYPLYLKDRSSVLTPNTSFCANGFYHGFMEALVTSTRSPERAAEFCALVQKELVPLAPDAALQCYHGIGHGLMDLAASSAQAGETKTEEELLKPALDRCREVSRSPEQLYRCSSGAFNSLANVYVKGEFGLSFNEQDPLAVCVLQPEEFKESCYGNMNSLLSWAARSDFLKAAAWVEDMEEQEFAPASLRYLAGLSSLGFARGNFDGASQACAALAEPLRIPCVEGFAHGFLEHGAPDEGYKEALAFCDSGFLASPERDACLSYTLSGLEGWYPLAKARDICLGLLTEYQGFCSDRVMERGD